MNENKHDHTMLAGPRRQPTATSGPLLEFDLDREIELLQAEQPWQADHTSKTLAKYPDMRVVLIGMEEGAVLHRHRARGTIILRTLYGCITLNTVGKTVNIPPGQLVALDGMIPHDVQSLTTSYVLLSIAWSERQPENEKWSPDAWLASSAHETPEYASLPA